MIVIPYSMATIRPNTTPITKYKEKTPQLNNTAKNTTPKNSQKTNIPK